MQITRNEIYIFNDDNNCSTRVCVRVLLRVCGCVSLFDLLCLCVSSSVFVFVFLSVLCVVVVLLGG